MIRRSVSAIALFAAVSAYAFGAGSAKLNGWVSDSSCGAKHAGSGAECVKACLSGGSKPVFVDDAKKKVWAIDNPDAVKDVWGKHVAITATTNASAKTVHVDAVSALD